MRLGKDTIISSTSARILGLAVLGAMLVLSSPLRAETPAECQGVFQASDINGDGVLSGAEIAVSDHIDAELASALAEQRSVTLPEQRSVTLPEFMAACSD